MAERRGNARRGRLGRADTGRAAATVAASQRRLSDLILTVPSYALVAAVSVSAQPSADELTPEQIARAREANGRRKRITHGLVCGPYGQMFGTERQCGKYFTLWDPDHRIEVAPGQYRALFAELFDRAVTTTAYAIGDYRTTPGLAARLMEASGTAPPAAPSLRGFFARLCKRS